MKTSPVGTKKEVMDGALHEAFQEVQEEALGFRQMMVGVRGLRHAPRPSWWLLLGLVALCVTQGRSDTSHDYCMIGCSAHRLMGLRLALDTPHTLYWWPGPDNGRIWLEGPDIFEWITVNDSHRRKWHAISTSKINRSGEAVVRRYPVRDDGGDYCIESHSLSLARTCSFQQYLYVVTDKPSLWSLGCPGVPCGCPDVRSDGCEDHLPVISGCCVYQLRGLMLPLDVGVSRVFWWADTMHRGVMVQGAGLVELVDVDKVHEGLWHLVTTFNPARRGESSAPPCRVSSASLSVSWNCTQDINAGSSLSFRTIDTVANDFTPGHWALGCHDAPDDMPGNVSVECEGAAEVVTSRTLLAPDLAALATGPPVPLGAAAWLVLMVAVLVA